MLHKHVLFSSVDNVACSQCSSSCQRPHVWSLSAHWHYCWNGTTKSTSADVDGMSWSRCSSADIVEGHRLRNVHEDWRAVRCRVASCKRHCWSDSSRSATDGLRMQSSRRYSRRIHNGIGGRPSGLGDVHNKPSQQFFRSCLTNTADKLVTTSPHLTWPTLRLLTHRLQAVAM